LERSRIDTYFLQYQLSESDQWTCKKSYAYTSPDEPDPWITLKNVVARYDDKLRKGLKKKHLHMPLIVYVTRKRSRSFQGFLAIAEKVVNMLASKQFSQEEKNELFDIFVSLDSMMVIMINDAEQYGCASHLITRETVQTWRRLRCTAIGPQWGLSTASPNHYFSSLHPCAILDASRTSRWCTRTGRRLQRHAYGLYNVLGAICDFLELEIGGAALMCWQELKESLNLGLTLLQSVCLFIFLKDTPMMR